MFELYVRAPDTVTNFGWRDGKLKFKGRDLISFDCWERVITSNAFSLMNKPVGGQFNFPIAE